MLLFETRLTIIFAVQRVRITKTELIHGSGFKPKGSSKLDNCANTAVIQPMILSIIINLGNESQSLSSASSASACLSPASACSTPACSASARLSSASACPAPACVPSASACSARLSSASARLPSASARVQPSRWPAPCVGIGFFANA